MGPDLRIDWDEICANPADFEKLVKLLLQRLHPNGRAIDGAGGDEGREFEVRTIDRLELWEAKSFTGRVSRRNPTRRRQVEESLRSAARHQPDAWHLVVPIDHDPAELAWFNGLRAGDYPFIDQWCGRTWLEEQLGRPDNADLVRYATQSKLLEYVRQYKLETESLADGTASLLERHQALDRLANEVNLYWRPIVGRLPDGTPYASIEAKRDDAVEQAPITFSLGVAIPGAPENDAVRASWRENFELGTGAKISAEFITAFSATGPAGLGLPTGERIPDLIEFVAVPDTNVSDLPTQKLEVYEPGRPQPIASLVFHPENRTMGNSGARLTAYDAARTIQLTTDVRSDTLQLNLQSQDFRPIVPAALLPSLRFSRTLVPPNRLVLTVSRNERSSQHETGIAKPVLSEAPSIELVQFIEDLAVIQDRLNASFPVPESFTGQDARNAHQLRRLLDGERVEWLHGPLTVHLVSERIADFRAQFAERQQGWLRISYDNIEMNFGEHLVHTGPVWLLGEMSIDLNTICVDEGDAAPTAEFEVLGDGWMYAQLGVPEDQAGSGPDRPPGRGRVAVSASDTSPE